MMEMKNIQEEWIRIKKLIFPIHCPSLQVHSSKSTMKLNFNALKDVVDDVFFLNSERGKIIQILIKQFSPTLSLALLISGSLLITNFKQKLRKLISICWSGGKKQKNEVCYRVGRKKVGGVVINAYKSQNVLQHFSLGKKKKF